MKTSLQLLLLSLMFFLLVGTHPDTIVSQETESSLLYSGDVPCDSDHRMALLIFGEEPEDYDSREKTIKSLRSVLMKTGYSEERIIVLTNGNIDADSRANRTNILAALEKLSDAEEKASDGEDRELFIYASLKAVAPDDIPCLVCPSNANTLDDLIPENMEEARYKPDRLIDLASEFIEPINRSPMERKLLILNTISPRPQTRGNVKIRERGVTRGKIADVTRETGQAFGQIVITDSLHLGPGTVNSFVEILEKGIEGYADSTDTGNLDGKVEMNELLAYIERFGNMTSQDAVRTLFKGHDFTMASYHPEKDSLKIQKDMRNAYLEEIKRLTVTSKNPPARTNQTAVAKGKWYCLLFAVGDFENPDVGLVSLDGPHYDMRMLQEQWLLPMQQQMATERRTKPENVMEIILLSDRKTDESGKSVPKEEHEANFSTKDNFMTQLERITKQAGPDDFILVAVACHGFASQGRSVLCAYDILREPFKDHTNKSLVFANTSNPQAVTNQINAHVIENRLIAVKDVIDLLGKSQAKKKLFLADACREIANSNDATREDFMTEFKTLLDSFYKNSDPKTQGLAVMTSCSLGQQAIEEPEGFRDVTYPNGIFFKFFVQGLNTKADAFGCQADMEGNQNGSVSLNEAYNYAFTYTSKEALQEWKSVQTPELFRGASWNDFPLRSKTVQTGNTPEFDATDEFLIHQAILRKDAGDYSKSREILTYLINMEPNHSQAYVYRSGVHLASLTPPKSQPRRQTDPMAIYRSALEDSGRIGRTLDLYVVIPQGKNGKTAPLYETPAEQTPVTDAQNKPMGIYVNQKVSVSAIQGDWLYVMRSSDDAAQNGLGWIHKNYVTWSEQSVEQYRPSTRINNIPSVSPMESIPAYRKAPIRSPGAGGMSPVSMPGITR